MKKVILNLAQTYDGHISRLDGTVDYLEQFGSGNEVQFKKFLSEVDSVIMGRNTYDEYNKYGWDYLAGKRVIVLSSRDGFSEIAEFYSGDLTQLVRSINNNIWCFGGTKVIKSFLEADLIDEFQITTVPKIIGKGKRVFEIGDYDLNLELVKTFINNSTITCIYKVVRR
jgi:dihydrofolate reductase